MWTTWPSSGTAGPGLAQGKVNGIFYDHPFEQFELDKRKLTCFWQISNTDGKFFSFISDSETGLQSFTILCTF